MLITTLMLSLFLLAVLGIGVYNLFKVRHLEEFLVAGRRAGGITTGGSLAATIIGGSSTLGLAGLAFARGLSASWWLLVGVAGLLALFFLLPAAKAFQVYTLPELIGKWYGETVRKIASLLIVCAWLGIVGAQANAAGRILSSLWGGGTLLMTCLAGGLFILYTAAGGQVSVIRTDLIQIALILLGILSGGLMGLRAVGGWEGLRQGLPADHFAFPLSGQFALSDLLLLVLVVGSTYLIGPDMLSRVFCSRTVGSARRGVAMAVVLIIPLALMISLIGMEARVLFPQQAGEGAFPLLIRQILPPWLGALTLLALLSAFLSSADTTLLTMAAIVGMDLLGNPQAKVGRMRIITVLCGLAALLVGIYSGGIIPSLLLGYTVFSGGLLVPVIAGLTGRRLRRGPAIFCMISGGGLALAGKLSGQDLLIVAGFGIALVVWIADQALGLRRPRVVGGAPGS